MASQSTHPLHQCRFGRIELLATSFATIERNVRSQLAATLADGGFDPARDIEAITMKVY
jgi:spermidine dehydrogenase